MKKITKRDCLFFILGLVVMFVFEIMYNWHYSVKSFKAGWERNSMVTNTEQTKY